MNNKLVDYIKNSLAKEIPRETIEVNLLRSGWQREQIDSAFQSLDQTGGSEKSESRHSGSLLLRITFSIIIFVGYFIATGMYWYGVEQSPQSLAERPLAGINALSLLLIGLFLALFSRRHQLIKT